MQRSIYRARHAGVAKVQLDAAGNILRQPPFDEARLLESGEQVRGGSITGVLALAANPFGERAFHYEFVDARLEAMTLIDDPGSSGQPGVPPDGTDFIWRTGWSDWCEWRAGDLSGEQFLERSKLAGSWGFIALVQGLFEADHFISGRRELPKPAPELLILRLLEL